MTRLVVMYPKPADPSHFDKHFREKHMPLVEEDAGPARSSYGPAKGPDGGDGAFFWVFNGTFGQRRRGRRGAGLAGGPGGGGRYPELFAGGADHPGGRDHRQPARPKPCSNRVGLNLP